MGEVRVGIVDVDTTHAIEFTKRLNRINIGEGQWVEGARVVCFWAGSSAIRSDEEVKEFARVLREELGVRQVDDLKDMLDMIDAVMIESVDGSVHYERALPFIEAGIPTFIDKPFTCSFEQAKRLAELAEEKGVPLFTSSSLRYAVEVQELKARADEYGAVLGADAYSPAPYHERNPGLFHYGIHAVETLYALMGRGCRQVWCAWQEGAEVVIGIWADGRIGTVRGTRSGVHGYGFTAFCERKIIASSIDTRFIYRELLKRVVEMFQTGKPPLDIQESLEIVAFIEAAMRSMRCGGSPQPVIV
ncbi:MAG: Gfo/Idh/MocA family oxidoreductase [Armatimonadetes bacterium]|nr:Gfo/Idh/MocA family oxidoreductase [Armatimonadota bacterium]MCX7776941.1 Gfo/Idh/MocA family oxidoreductase [Armatimonadota bacterium]